MLVYSLMREYISVPPIPCEMLNMNWLQCSSSRFCQALGLLTIALLSSQAPAYAERVRSNQRWTLCLEFDHDYTISKSEFVIDPDPKRLGGEFAIKYICVNEIYREAVIIDAGYNSKGTVSGVGSYFFTQTGGELTTDYSGEEKKINLPDFIWKPAFNEMLADGGVTIRELKQFAREVLLRIWTASNK